jgi:hypothetical protein
MAPPPVNQVEIQFADRVAGVHANAQRVHDSLAKLQRLEKSFGVGLRRRTSAAISFLLARNVLPHTPGWYICYPCTLRMVVVETAARCDTR